MKAVDPGDPAGPLVGAHVSTAGGLRTAIGRATSIGARTIQVFTKSSNQWAAKPLDPGDARAFREGAAAAGLAPLVAHAAYLINLASPDAAIRERSVTALADEIERCALAGIGALVLHPGSHGGDGTEEGLDRIARGLDEALEQRGAAPTRVLLESAAGQGACLGHTLGELAEMRRRASHKARLGICLDTCHLHAAGYDVVSRDGWAALMAELDATGLLPLVSVIHANDSRKERGCRVDRHERIGHGAIGEAGFANLMREPAFGRVPKILETPKDEAGDHDRDGLATLRRLAGAGGSGAPAVRKKRSR